MNFRDLINIVSESSSDASINRTERVHQQVGKELKELLRLINLNVISDNDLAVHVIGTIEAASRREGDSRLDAVATMYGKSNREDLELDEMVAKVDKLRAEADKIDRS